MKNITIAGRCTKDAEIRQTQDGKQVAGFSVAVDDGFGQNKSTLFFDCSLWGARADKLAPMLVKGKQVCVNGDLGTREYNGKTYLTVRASEVTLLGGGQRNDDTGHSDPARQAPDGYGAQPGGKDIEDSIPF